MNRFSTLFASTTAILGLCVVTGCGGGDSGGSANGGSPNGGASSGGTSSGGGGTTASGGSAGSTSSGGTAGQAQGGDANGGGGATSSGGSAAFTWPDTYDPAALPDPSDGNHHDGDNCLSCHDVGGIAGASRVWLFGGTVYQSDGTTPAVHVEVAVTDGTNTYTTYSATNGNFWVPASQGTLTWASARAFVRNGNGVLSMDGNGTPQAGCNNCHTGTATPRITEP